MRWKVVQSLYLSTYNAVQAVGWYSVLFLTLRHLWLYLQPNPSLTALLVGCRTLLSTVGPQVALLQHMCWLEVVHAWGGLCGAPIPTLLQVVGRNHIIHVVLGGSIPPAQHSLWVAPLLVAWTLAECIRYPTYCLGESAPRWLSWLRYSMFLPLQPIGFLSEMGLLWVSLPFVRSQGTYSVFMPNTWNVIFDYHLFLQVALVLYVPLAPVLFLHMLRQRRAKLGGRDPSARKASNQQKEKQA